MSRPLLLRIAPPRGYEEEVVAQDFFTDEVSRVLAFDGSRVLSEANKVLRDVVDRLGDRRVAKHARVPLGLSVAEPKQGADRRRRRKRQRAARRRRKLDQGSRRRSRSGPQAS